MVRDFLSAFGESPAYSRMFLRSLVAIDQGTVQCLSGHARDSPPKSPHQRECDGAERCLKPLSGSAALVQVGTLNPFGSFIFYWCQPFPLRSPASAASGVHP
jgi:hypothetical protein